MRLVTDRDEQSQRHLPLQKENACLRILRVGRKNRLKMIAGVFRDST